MQIKKLTSRQIRQIEILIDFNIKIQYQVLFVSSLIFF